MTVDATIKYTQKELDLALADQRKELAKAVEKLELDDGYSGHYHNGFSMAKDQVLSIINKDL